ncbi:MAG: hypothetical protein GX481_08455 [Atopobium sp.]|nr:hypothetical protein [Atopobium sp.]
MMPRRARRHGGANKTPGISNELVCIVAGANDRGDCFAELCCRGRATTCEVESVLDGRISEGAIVSTDRHGSYPGALSALGVLEHRRYDSKTQCDRLSLVNSLHSRLGSFLARFNGVATRRLQHYLDWFCWMEQTKGGTHDRREILWEDAAAGKYETTRRGYAETPHPFMEWWGAMPAEV